MKHEEVIELLTKQNERLLTILEKFAEKDINIVVNSYNGAYGESNVENAPTTLNGDNKGICSHSNSGSSIDSNAGALSVGNDNTTTANL